MSNDDTQRAFEIAVKAAYDIGYRNGIEAYATWKDGRQYVGSNSLLLDLAIKGRREAYNYRPPTAQVVSSDNQRTE